MDTNFQYIEASPITQHALTTKGLSKLENAIFNKKDTALKFIVNHQANIFWMVDTEGLKDANNRVKHLTGTEIQPFKRSHYGI